ncbi:protein inturned [Trichonephila clavipes]|nr:protein inturned [Trichonephila clavipes]
MLRSSLLVVFLVAPVPVFRTWIPSRVHYFQQFLTAHSERSTCSATRRVDQPAVFIPMIRPLSNSLNCEKCLLARLPGMFRLPKSSYNRRVIVTAEGHPPPEPFYVEEVQNTLIILHDCGITSGIEKILHQCLPPLASPHLFMKEHSSVRNLFSIFSNASSSSSLNSSSKNIGSRCNQSITGLEKVGQKITQDISLDRSDDFEAERQQLLFAMGPADGESDVDSSYSDVSNENLYTRQSSRSYSFSTGSTTESAGSGEFSNQQGQSFKRITSNNSDMNHLQIGYENCLLESTSQ